MDSVTQAALGALVGEAVLGQRLGNRALLWGAALGTLPDLDVVFAPFLDTAGELVHHRGASHSITIMVAASLLLAPLLARRWAAEGITRTRAAWFVFLVWSTHVLIDCFTVYGTSVYWPFSDYRAGFNHLFIIDPFYTGPMLAAIAWIAFLRRQDQRRRRMRLCLWGLGISTAYVCLSLAAKWTASAGFAADLERRGIAIERRMEAPTAFNILLWRAVVDCGDELMVGYRSVLDSGSTPVRWTVYPRGRASVEPYLDAREVKTAMWFSQGYWLARPQPGGVWLGDLRFSESTRWRTDSGEVDNRLAFAWVYSPDAQGDRLRRLSSGRGEARGTLDRMMLRIRGDRTAWDLSPGLDGIPGAIREPLELVD